MELRSISRWLNAISISISRSLLQRDSSLLDRLCALEFVQEIDIVRSYERRQEATVPRAQDSSMALESDQEPSVIRANHGRRQVNANMATNELRYGGSRAQLETISVIPLHNRGLNGSGVQILMLDSGSWPIDWLRE